MTDNVVQFRDFQNKRDLERLYAEAGNDCAIAASLALIENPIVAVGGSVSSFGGLTGALIPHDREVDTAPSEYCAPDQDSA